MVLHSAAREVPLPSAAGLGVSSHNNSLGGVVRGELNMNVRKGLVASASVLGLTLSQGAGAFGMMEVGEWKVEFSGNVNAFVSDVKCDADAGGGLVLSGLACGSFTGADYDDNNIRTGLLPSWLGFHAERTEGSTKYGVTLGFQPGVDGANQNGIAGGPIDGALGLNASNFRQVFLEFSGGLGRLQDRPRPGPLRLGRDPVRHDAARRRYRVRPDARRWQHLARPHRRRLPVRGLEGPVAILLTEVRGPPIQRGPR